MSDKVEQIERIAELERKNAKLVMKLNAEYLVRQNVERENAKLRDELDFCLKYAPNCDECAAMLDCDECLRADASQKERKRLDYENAKLRELLVGAFEDMNAWQRVIACSNEWGYGRGCLDRLCKLRDAMQELGMEVVV